MLSLFNRSSNQLSSSIILDHSGLVEQHIVLALVKLFGIFQCGSHLAPERGPPGARFFYCLAEWRNRKTVMPQELEGIKDDQRFGWFPNQPKFFAEVSHFRSEVSKTSLKTRIWLKSASILATHGLQKSFWKKMCYVSLLRKCIHLRSQNPSESSNPSDPAMLRSRGTKRRAFLVSGFLHIAWQDDTNVLKLALAPLAWHSKKYLPERFNVFLRG